MSRRGNAFWGGMLMLGIGGCGGGHGGGTGFTVGSTETPGSGTSYAFVAPVVNSSRVYAATIVDNSNNTIEVSYTVTVTAVGADGTITQQQTNDGGTGDTVNGTDYAPLNETQTLNAAGRETGYTYTESTGALGSCSYTPYGGGAEPPLTVGQSWTVNYTQVCNGNAPIDYSQTGKVVDLESVTVPAGTFSALKLQSTTSWTDAHGTTHSQTTSNWLDVATFRSVKQSITYVDGGTLPSTGYAVSREIVLQSTS